MGPWIWCGVVLSDQVRALETFLILHMDHEQNASTSTVRIAGLLLFWPCYCS